MKIVAFICNVVFFGFTCLVLVTDGTPREAGYIVVTLLVVLVPILSAVVIFRSGVSDGWLGLHSRRKVLEGQGKIDDLPSMSSTLKIVTIVCNIILFGFVCWALVRTYPHPEEDGFIEYALLSVLTPILNLVVVFRSGGIDGWLGLHTRRKALEGPVKADDPAKKHDA